MHTHVTLPDNPISSTVPFDEDGAHHGHLRLPYSRDDSAWGSVMIPITVIRNGPGQTALLTGGNHGDEYEGPVALFDLANTLKPEDVDGRVIIAPAMNYPAFRSASRTSPIDKYNLNRTFPGHPGGSVTEKIADYFERTLLPMADYVLDIHSGGKTLDFIPFAAAHVLPDKTQEARCVAAMHAFNAPYSMMLLEIDNVGMYDTAAENQGKVFISTEVGGGGTSTARSCAITKRGVANFLKHCEIMKGEPEIRDSVALDIPDMNCYVFCEHEGLVEPVVDLGEPVNVGDVVALIHSVERTGVRPFEYRAQRDGLLAARHFPGLVKIGDCLAVLAVPA